MDVFLLFFHAFESLDRRDTLTSFCAKGLAARHPKSFKPGVDTLERVASVTAVTPTRDVL